MNYKDLQISDFDVFSSGNIFISSKIELEKRANLEISVSRDNGNYYCLFSSESQIEKLPEINGLKITYQQFRKSGSDFSNFIVIECSLDGYLNNFILIIKEIIETFENSNFEISKAVNIVISKWRYFLASPKPSILNQDEIIGLMGELYLLEKLIDKLNIDAIDFWVANKGQEDFIFESNIIEVKSTLKDKHEHIINGIDQLLLYPEKNKFILSLLYCKSFNQNGVTLPLIIESCSNKLKPYPDKINIFFSIIKSRGYDIRDADQYSEFVFELLRGGYFLVDSQFPKLTKNELKDKLSNRISKIRYTIDMEGLSNYDFISTDLDMFL
jgi:hypothetical protein